MQIVCVFSYNFHRFIVLNVAQNFFKDAWNVFDFITVIGSIIDAMVLEIGVCKISFDCKILHPFSVQIHFNRKNNYLFIQKLNFMLC